MARIGVTYADIAKAAQAIKSRGDDPTVDRVREYTGTGSKSTIAPLLKRWRMQNDQAGVGDKIPSELAQPIANIHERLQQLADIKIEQAQAEFLAVTENLQKELSEAKKSIECLTTDRTDMEQQIKTLSDKNRSLETSLEDARIAMAKSEVQHKQAESRTNELTTTIGELKKENHDIRDHFEHYQQRSAEDRQRERENFSSINQQLQRQVQDFNIRLIQAESNALEQLEIHNKAQRNIDELGTTNKALQLEINRNAKENQILIQKMSTLQAKFESSNNEIQTLREKVAFLKGQRPVADNKIDTLNQLLTKVETQLQTKKNRIDSLTSENKVILQEKAVIQGQLKQLQIMLEKTNRQFDQNKYSQTQELGQQTSKLPCLQNLQIEDSCPKKR